MKKAHRLLSEAPRDQAESVFTTILRRVLATDARLLAVMMVDGEGECVDYCSTLSAFDTKVIGAHYQVLLMDAVERLHTFAGVVWEIETTAETMTVLARRIQDQYSIMVVSKCVSTPESVRRTLHRAAVAIRREAGLSVPDFEGAVPKIEVRVRESDGWPYAPAEFLRVGADAWTKVHSVLGRWRNWNEELLCFRIRTMAGDELTLAHDDEVHLWELFEDEEGAFLTLAHDLENDGHLSEHEQAGSQPASRDDHHQGGVAEEIPGPHSRNGE